MVFLRKKKLELIKPFSYIKREYPIPILVKKMSMKKKEKQAIIIENILSRFIRQDLNYKPNDFKTINDILELPIFSMRDMEKMQAVEIINYFKTEKISELANLDPVNPITILLPDPRDFPDQNKYEIESKIIIGKVLEDISDFEQFRNHIAVAQMIKKSWKKREVFIKKKETKFICVGLDNAGKTAILTGLGGKLGITELNKLKPTKKIERKKISTTSMDLFVWDFGGQVDYRRDYLKNPEYFIDTDMFLYVIDMQDPERFSDSFEYLIEILNVMKTLGENPYILAFMHKSAPDILDDPDFQLNTEFVADKLNYHLNNYEYEFDIYTTSIYNFFTSEPKFSRFIKETLSDKESLNNPVIRKIEGLGDIMDSTLNAIVTLANSLGEQIAKLAMRVDELEIKLDNEVNKFVPLPKTTQQKKVGGLNKSILPSSNNIIFKSAPSGTKTSGLRGPPSSQVTGVPASPQGLRGPPGSRISSSKNLQSSLKSNDPRLTILNELGALFQAKRNLDSTTKLSKLGEIGKKFEKTKKPTNMINAIKKASIKKETIKSATINKNKVINKKKNDPKKNSNEKTIKYEKETGKKAIWRNKETKGFKEWLKNQKN